MSGHSVLYNLGDKMDYKMKYKAVYLSEFSDVFYVVEKNVVLVHWKPFFKSFIASDERMQEG